MKKGIFLDFLKFFYQKLPNNFKVKLGYFLFHKSIPNINHPTSLNEKILNRILYDKNEMYPILADKFLVREYIQKVLSQDVLVPLVLATQEPKDLEQLKSLQNTVVKPNHGAGMVQIYDTEPSIVEKNKLIAQCKQWLKIDYSKAGGEWHYSQIKPYILVEQKITASGESLRDYKFHRFLQQDGSYKQVLQVIAERSTNGYETVFFDVNNLDEILHSPFYYTFSLSDFEKKHINYIVNYNEKICPENGYLRIDWYITEKQIYFGEITLTSGSGKSKSLSGIFGIEMGKLWVVR